ncbi:MAG: hypothetical protein FJ020_09195 [Chloroflexi bacterium]|nr:hypothetical protein [Chloroflexota bacterium]
MARKGSIGGLIVFFLGIALLIGVFVVALLAFLTPTRIAAFRDLIPAPQGEWGGVVKAIGYAVALGLLQVMGFVAGKVTMYGIKMYKSLPSSERDEDAQPQAEMVKETKSSVVGEKAPASVETVVEPPPPAQPSSEPAKVNPSLGLMGEETRPVAAAERDKEPEPIVAQRKRKH